MQKKTLFVATPISALPSNEDYILFRDWVLMLNEKIINSGYFDKVFCIASKVKSQSSLNDPIQSLKGDIAELSEASDFLFIYPMETATSALIELGYALAKNKNIKIVHLRQASLPFMATKMDQVFDNIEKLEIDKLDSHSINKIMCAISK